MADSVSSTSDNVISVTPFQAGTSVTDTGLNDKISSVKTEI
jgi:hypothetical protein